MDVPGFKTEVTEDLLASLLDLISQEHLNEGVIGRFQVEADHFSPSGESETLLHAKRTTIKGGGLFQISSFDANVGEGFDRHMVGVMVSGLTEFRVSGTHSSKVNVRGGLISS